MHLKVGRKCQALSRKVKEVPEIQRWIWQNPHKIEDGLSWNRKEYPFNIRVDFKGKDKTAKVVLGEAKNKAKKDHVYQVIAQKYCYLYAHVGEHFRTLLICQKASEGAKTLAKKFGIEVIELPTKALKEIKLDYSKIEGFLTKRQFEAFSYLFVQRLPESEVANKMGVSKARVSSLKKQINLNMKKYFNDTLALIKIMKQAPEVFKGDLDQIGDLVG
jgi:predicted DNA-binding protein YlxM (UPF0122 family)